MRVFNYGEYISGFGWGVVPALEPTTEIYNLAPHAIWVELGRRPGGRVPPLDAIRKYLAGRGFDVSEDDHFVLHVATNIAIFGIEPRPVFEVATPKARQVVWDEIRRAIDRVR